MEGVALQRPLLGIPRVLAVCTRSMLGAGRPPRAPQHSMRLEPPTRRFLIAIGHCASALYPRATHSDGRDWPSIAMRAWIFWGWDEATAVKARGLDMRPPVGSYYGGAMVGR